MRVRSALFELKRWYLSWTGLLSLLVLVLCAIAASGIVPAWTVLVPALVLVAVFLPLRFRGEMRRLDTVRSEATERTASAEQAVSDFDARLWDLQRELHQRSLDLRALEQRMLAHRRQINLDIAESEQRLARIDELVARADNTEAAIAKVAWATDVNGLSTRVDQASSDLAALRASATAHNEMQHALLQAVAAQIDASRAAHETARSPESASLERWLLLWVAPAPLAPVLDALTSSGRVTLTQPSEIPAGTTAIDPRTTGHRPASPNPLISLGLAALVEPTAEHEALRLGSVSGVVIVADEVDQTLQSMVEGLSTAAPVIVVTKPADLSTSQDRAARLLDRLGLTGNREEESRRRSRLTEFADFI